MPSILVGLIIFALIVAYAITVPTFASIALAAGCLIAIGVGFVAGGE